jgi:hypothetical protein
MSRSAIVPLRHQQTEIESEERTDAAPLGQDQPGLHEISAMAHQLWLQRGCPEGSPDEDWFRAEEELLHHHR